MLDAIEICNRIMLKNKVWFTWDCHNCQSPKQPPVVWITFRSNMWQSCVEIKDSSVAYIEQIAVFEVSYHWTSAKGGPHTRYTYVFWMRSGEMLYQGLADLSWRTRNALGDTCTNRGKTAGLARTPATTCWGRHAKCWVSPLKHLTRYVVTVMVLQNRRVLVEGCTTGCAAFFWFSTCLTIS